MVDALREARRVLAPPGVLIDVRPVTAPLVVEVVVSTEAVWATTVESYSAPEDVAASEAAVRHAVSHEWIVLENGLRFDFEVYCDSAAELRVYAEGRKLYGAEIPYEELEQRRSESDEEGRPVRLRCRRPWMLNTYCKK